MKTIYLVTGATGFVGSNLVAKLLAAGKTVHALVRDAQKANRALGQPSNAKLFFGDVTNASDIEQLFDTDDAEYIMIHAAAIVMIGGSRAEYQKMYKVNLGGLSCVIDACVRHNAKLLYVSSVHTFRELKKPQVIVETRPFEPKKVRGHYAKTKAAASQMVLDAIAERGLEAVMVHPSGIIGPGDYGNSLLTQMVRDYKAGKIPAAVKGGYDFVDVRDVCDGILSAIERFKNGESYLLTNRFLSVKELLDALHSLTGGKRIKAVLPMWIARLGLPFLLLYAKLRRRRPLYTAYSLYTLSSNSNFSHAHATQDLAYHPRPLIESLTDTVQFLQQQD